MHLLIHQLKNDIYRMRWLLLAWIAFLVTSVGLQIFLTFQREPYYYVIQYFFLQLAWSAIFSALQTFFILVLLPILVHGDSFVGTTGFWMTKPISRSLLLKSKGLFIFVFFVILPALGTTVLFAANQINLYYTFLATMTVIFQQVGWIALAFALCCITRNIAGYAIGCASIAVVGVLLSYMAESIRDAHQSRWADILQEYSSGTGIASQYIVILIACMIVGGVVITHQMIYRRQKISLLIFVLGFMLAIALPQIWHFDFFAPPADKNVPTFDASTVQMVFPQRASRIGDSPYLGEKSKQPLKEIFGDVELKLPDSFFPVIYDIVGTIKHGDEKLTPDLLQMDSGTRNNMIHSDALSVLLEGISIYGGKSTKSLECKIALIREDFYKSWKNQPVSLNEQVWYFAYYYEIATELPAKIGSISRKETKQFSVAQITPRSQGVGILLEERNVNLLFAPQQNEVPMYSPYPENQPAFLLVNRQKKEAIASLPLSSFYLRDKSQLSTRWIEVEFSTTNSENFPGKLDEQWLQNATLVIIQGKHLGRYSKEISTNNFIVNPPAAP